MRKFYHFTFKIPADDFAAQGRLWEKRLRFIEALCCKWDSLLDTDWQSCPLEHLPTLGLSYVSNDKWTYCLARDWVLQLGFEIVSECPDAPTGEADGD